MELIKVAPLGQVFTFYATERVFTILDFLRNWPHKLEHLSLVSLYSLVLWNSLAYWADS